VTLIGGSPLRLLRLPAAVNMVARSLGDGLSIAQSAELHGRSVRVVEALARRLLLAGLGDPVFEPSLGELDCSQKDVTVVIPVRNRAYWLDRLLATLDDSNPGIRVIVVDDGSDEAVADVTERHRSCVSFIRHEVPLGPAAARNRGLADVQTPLVAFVDSDVVPSVNWLEGLLPHFADPAVAVVAPRVESADASEGSMVERRIRAYEVVRSPLDLGRAGGYVFPKTRIAYLPAAVLIGRVEVLRRLNGFATDMWVGEDVDLMWRIIETGHLVRYEPASVVHHEPRTTLSALAAQRFSYASSSAALNRAHTGNVRPVSGNRWSYLAWMSPALLGWPGLVVGLGISGVTAALLPRKLTSLSSTSKVGLRLAIRGHLGMGRMLANAIWRAWLPIVIVLAVRSPRWRAILAASAVVPAVQDWLKDRPDLDLTSYLGLRLIDDSAYCMGLWKGCLAAKDVGALLPEIVDWPNKPPARQDG
jgi:mycofactocin glycosyltransferase